MVITDASAESIHKFIINNIETGSKIITDGFVSYSGIDEKGYTHKIYVHKNATTAEEKLPHAHLVISLMKRWLIGTHQGAVSEKHLQTYLDEYVFRFNRRTAAKRGLLFYRLLENAMIVGPTTLKEIIGKTYIL